MRVLIVAPGRPATPTGNVRTVTRLRDGLASRLAPPPAIAWLDETPDLPARLERDRPEVLHAYHARRAGRPCLAALDALAAGDRPAFVVTLPGTDVQHDLDDPDRADAVLATLERADVVIATSSAVGQELSRRHPEIGARTRVVRKAVTRLDRAAAPDLDIRALAGASGDDVVFLFPAGIRPVKGNLRPIEAFARLRRGGLPIRLVLVGPDLDADYAARVREAAAASEGAVTVAGSLEPEAMGKAYADADVVVNASETEGLANVLLEAMAAAKPILASAIPGNREVVEPSGGGVLFDDEASLIGHIEQLTRDADHRARLGEAGRRWATENASPDAETTETLTAYRDAITHHKANHSKDIHP